MLQQDLPGVSDRDHIGERCGALMPGVNYENVKIGPVA